MSATTSLGSGPQLALPVGDRPAPRRAVAVGSLLAAVATVSLFGALSAAYIGLKIDTRDWLPEGVQLDNYLATTIAITLLMGSVTVEWAFDAVKRDLRGQTMAAYLITIGLGIAAAVGVWYLGAEAGFGPGAHPFAVVFFTFLAMGGLAVAIGTGAVVLALVRAIGQQLDPRENEHARGTAWLWHAAAVAWLFVYGTVYLYK